MKRLVAVVLGGLGLGALLRRWRRRPAQVEPEAVSDTDSFAEELRAKLAESRAAVATEPVAEEAAEPAEAPADAPAEEPADLDSRRREVHERARQARDELS